ncbi:MAG: hypothetical protein FWC92_03055 [Defluviitaleaceae bacterium]|nr:hypothetical protein [Defluviitaleaceae bacterium]
MSNPRGYKKALVIFIDILGSQSRNDFHELYEINELFHSELLGNQKQEREYVAYRRHIYTFSDCAYIFYDYKDNVEIARQNLGALFEVALCNCEPLLLKFLSKGLIFRGGVAYGDVYYDESKNMFFGEAVNKAFKYENDIAKYPRIIVDKFVGDTITHHFKKVVQHYDKSNMSNFMPNPKEQDGCIVKLDTDGQYHLHYLNSIQQGMDYSAIIGQSNYDLITTIISTCDKQINSFSKNSNIRSKYEWLKKYAMQSSNDEIGEPLVYQKPFWDRLLGKLFKKNRKEDIFKQMFNNNTIMMMSNVGIPFDEDSHLKTVLNYIEQNEFDVVNELEKSEDSVIDFSGFGDILEVFGKKKVEQRWNTLYTAMNAYITKNNLCDFAYVDNGLLSIALVDYFHDVQRIVSPPIIDDETIIAYTAYWILHIRPIQVYDKIHSSNSELAFINEKFVAQYLSAFISGYRECSNAPYYSDDKLEDNSEPILYSLINKSPSAQCIKGLLNILLIGKTLYEINK